MDNKHFSEVVESLEEQYSEGKALEILHKSFEVLHWGIERATRFSFVNLSAELAQMTDQELTYWNSILNLEELVREDFEKRQLVVADLRNIEEDAIVQEVEQLNTKFDFAAKSKFGILPIYPEKYKYYATLAAFDPIENGLNFYIRPRFRLGSLIIKKALFLPSLDIEIFATDKLGRLVVSADHKNFKVKDLDLDFTGKSAEDMKELYGIYGPPVFSGYQPTFGRISFNTTIDTDKENAVYSRHFRPSIVLKAELHNKGKINSTKLPEDIKAKLFFWQMSQFLERDQLRLEGPQPKFSNYG